MALFQKTKYIICFISVSYLCTWHAIKIEENFQKSPRPTPRARIREDYIPVQFSFENWTCLTSKENSQIYRIYAKVLILND